MKLTAIYKRVPEGYIGFVEEFSDTNMQMKLTAVYKRVPEGYIGFVEELPGANTQGETLEETRTNLQEAIEMILEANRILAEEFISKAPNVISEPFFVQI